MSGRNEIYSGEPEHGVERHRIKPGQPWTPELRRHYAQTSIRLLAARIEGANIKTMIGIIEDADLVPQLGGMFFTLTRGQEGEKYARSAIGWAYENAELNEVNLDPEIKELVERHSVMQMA